VDAISLENVTKSYDEVKAVDGVSLRVKEGAILGLLGPNGAGKTSTIRMVMNILAPDAGSIRVFGQPVADETREAIGYLPEERGLYQKMKVLDVIVFLAALRGLSEAEAHKRAREWLDRFGLGSSAEQKVQELSKGMQQKVQFISTVLHKPRLMILDEPFSGLDPVNAVTVKDTMLEMSAQGTTIVLSTHRMEQVEKLCDSICLINKGHNVLDGDLRSIKESYGKNTAHIEFTGPDGFLNHPAITSVNRFGSGAEAKLKPGGDSQEVLKAALESGARINRFELLEPSLNDIFIEKIAHE
jgi:ABC-2 type transport system ATP-binding protein